METKTILITDNTGNEHLFHVLFTIETKNHLNLVFYYEPDDPDTVFCARYDQKGQLFDLTEIEQKEADRLLKKYEEQEEDDLEEEDGEEKIGN